MRKRRNSAFLNAGIACAMLGASLQAAHAYGFDLGDGWEANGNSSVSLGSSFRTYDRDKYLYSATTGNVAYVGGGQGKNTIDEGEVNYGKGSNFSTLLKGFTEMEVKKGELGAFVRAKAWYDFALEKEDVQYGNQPNGYNGYNPATGHITTKKPLSDAGFPTLDKFSGVYLLDAYAYDSWDVSGHPLEVRVGNQVLNWGESVFIQGVNQINPIDVPSFRKPGAELKEVFLPAPIFKSGLGLGKAGSVEAFWQFKYMETPIEAGCGNYWSVAEGMITSANANFCNNATPVGVSAPQGVATGAYVPTLNGIPAKDAGEFGAAYRFQAYDTEFGLYAMQIHARIPTVGIVYGNFNYLHSVIPMASRWFDQQDMKVYGLSATTTVLGWSVAGELSQTHGFPAQIDGNDLLTAGLEAPFVGAAVGPVGPLALAQWHNFLAGKGGAIAGDTLTDKTQFQVNALQVGTGFLGAQQWLLIGEVGFQWNGLPDYHNDPTALRYNRPFIFGLGPNALLGPTCAPGDGNSGCRNDGYVTNFAWGYRLLGQLTYNNVLGSGVTAQPKLFFSHDVKGYSVDSQFNAERMAIGLSVKLTYEKRYWLELAQTMYNHNAPYDPLRDRDFFSATVGASF